MDRAGVFDGAPVAVAAELIHAGAAAAIAADTAVIVVAEDAGNGVLPADAGSRAWLDLLGEATQQLAAAADELIHVVAGHPTVLRGRPAASPAGLRHHGDRDVRPGDADHAVNVVAGGPPAWLRTALVDALDQADRYPDDTAAVAAVAALHGRDADEVVAVNGAAEALWLLGPALRPKLAACVHPAFTESEAGLRAHGIPVARVLRDPDADFALDPSAVPDEADLVVVGNPASPSGTLDPATAILALRRPDRVIVVDEAFMGLVPGEPGSLAGEPLDDVIVVRSLTKILSIPGLRVGYALAPPPLAEQLRAVRPPWSANTLALAALEAAAAAPAELAAIARRTDADRADLAHRLAAIDGVRTWRGAANFCLVEVADGPAATARLRDRGIAVRPAASFPGLGAGHLRLTARDPDANERLADALAAAIGVPA
jgi:histidinol-phosphate/aromatic aminotransferase/cobyric acid decarboxylase-like protein